MRRRAVILALFLAAARATAAPYVCDLPSEGGREAPSDDDGVGRWQLHERAARLEQRALMLLHSESDTTSSPQVLRTDVVRSPVGVGGAGDTERLRAAALELRGQLEEMESLNEHALPEIRLEVSKLETAVVQAQARAAHADEAQEGTRRWLRAVVAAYGRRATRDRRLLLRLGRALAAAARHRARARTMHHG